jgi:hypothetical protein
MSRRPPRTTAICPGCGAEAPLRIDGHLYSHRGFRAWQEFHRCPFSGWLAAEVELYAYTGNAPTRYPHPPAFVDWVPA